MKRKLKLFLINKTALIKQAMERIDKNGYGTVNRQGRLSKLKKRKLKLRSVKRVLVIGGGGYLGSILVRLLLKKNYYVDVLDSFVYGNDSLKKIRSNKLNVYEGDTRHIEDVARAAESVDAVVHLAEIVGDPAAALNPKTTTQVNYLATRLVASVCKYYQINRLIYASSCSVYGKTGEKQLLTESSPLNPVSLYARMKIHSEQALQEMADENFFPTILRLATIYGKSSRPRFDLVINLLTAKAVLDKEITIIGGSQWRPVMHVTDAARAIIKVLESPIDKVGGEIFNVGSNRQNYRIKDLAKIVKRVVPSAKIKYIGKDADQRSYRIDFSKLKNVLSFKTSMTVKKGVEEIKDWIKKEKIKDYQNIEYSNVKSLKVHKTVNS